MQLPRGWTFYDPLAYASNRPVKCECCEWKGHESDLDESVWSYNGIYQRISPGDVMPAGTCPKSVGKNRLCSSLVYFNDVVVAFKEIPNILEQIAEATQ
jgi:hypothetical protein